MTPSLEDLAVMSLVYEARLVKRNGPLPERVLLPIQCAAADIRYMELIGQQREATRRRWVLMKQLRGAGLKWVRI